MWWILTKQYTKGSDRISECRLVLKNLKRQSARREIVEEDEEAPCFGLFVDFFDSSFYFCQSLFGYDCYGTFKQFSYQSEACFETNLLIPLCDGKPEDLIFFC